MNVRISRIVLKKRGGCKFDHGASARAIHYTGVTTTLQEDAYVSMGSPARRLCCNVGASTDCSTYSRHTSRAPDVHASSIEHRSIL